MPDEKTLTPEEQEMKDAADKSIVDSPKESSLAVADMYKGVEKAGTEEISQEDLNTPTLKIVQQLTSDVENKKEGSLYRSDTGEQADHFDVNLVYVTTQEMDNYNKTAKEKVKVYFGYFAGTNEPFRMYIRGWSLANHRAFQTQVSVFQRKFKTPMFALTVRLATEKQEGNIKESGKPYKTYKMTFTPLLDARDQTGQMPQIEMNPDRIGFLFETVQRFKEAALVTSPSDDAQNGEDLPWEQGGNQ